MNTNIYINKWECVNISIFLVLNHGRYHSVEFLRLTESKDKQQLCMVKYTFTHYSHIW